MSETITGPLSGILVLDLTRVLAGPYCTMILCDLGARVIKIEPPGGDDSRKFGPFLQERSLYFMALNRGKEGLSLNLKNDEDRIFFNKILDKADILIENYRPGTMEKLGYGWDDLHAKYPRLIYAATSGFGHWGPYMRRPAYDMVAQGMGGVMSLTGTPGGPPTRVGTSVGDVVAGMFTAIGVNAALVHRERTGEGTKVDVAMLDSQVAILENAIPRYMASGVVPGPLGSRHPTITPFEAFATKDKHIIVACANDGLFALLCRTIGREELIENPFFTSNDLRTRHQAALKDELEATFALHGSEHWLELFEATGVPSAPINDLSQVVNDPQVKARNMVVTAEDKIAGTIHMGGNPIKISGFPDPPTRGPIPELDGDRARIAAEFGIEEA
jgi:CoA:oxalate CoA-transferase